VVGGRVVNHDNSPLVLMATVGLILLLAAVGYVGWTLGHEQGLCEATCEEATTGAGVAAYRGGTCRCMLNGQEVRPL